MRDGVGTPAQTLPTIRPVVTTNLKFPPLGGRLSSAKLPLGQPASSSTANPKRGSISDLHHSAGRCRVRADAVSRNASLRSRGRGFGRARSTVASRSCAGRAGRVSSGSLETVARERSARVPSDVRAQPPNEGPLCRYREGVTPQEKGRRMAGRRRRPSVGHHRRGVSRGNDRDRCQAVHVERFCSCGAGCPIAQGAASVFRAWR